MPGLKPCPFLHRLVHVRPVLRAAALITETLSAPKRPKPEALKTTVGIGGALATRRRRSPEHQDAVLG